MRFVKLNDMKNKKSKKLYLSYPIDSKEIPATQKMLYGVRDELKADIRALEAQLTSQIHRLGILIEEQNARNRIVMDGLKILFQRQERLEEKA